jgi:hypothetical protein
MRLAQLRIFVFTSAVFFLMACAAGHSGESVKADLDREVIPFGFDQGSLSYLECPLNGQKLRLAQVGELENLNQAIEELSLGDMQGQPIRGYLRGLLIREDGKVAYPISNGEALLTKTDAIDLARPAKSAPNRFNNMGRR